MPISKQKPSDHKPAKKKSVKMGAQIKTNVKKTTASKQSLKAKKPRQTKRAKILKKKSITNQW